MQITVVRSGSSCSLGEVLEHSEKVGPGGGGSIYVYIYKYTSIYVCIYLYMIYNTTYIIYI